MQGNCPKENCPTMSISGSKKAVYHRLSYKWDLDTLGGEVLKITHHCLKDSLQKSRVHMFERESEQHPITIVPLRDVLRERKT